MALAGRMITASSIPVARNLLWIMGAQTLCGSLFLMLAAWRLRPVFRDQDGGTRRRWSKWLASKRSWTPLPRPSCGNWPMVWKECFTTRSSALARAVGLLVGLVLGSLLAYHTVTQFRDAFLETLSFGYNISTPHYNWNPADSISTSSSRS